jgi:hypothetical protein
MLLLFFYQYSHCRPTKDLLHRILVAFCSLILTSPKIGCGLMGEQLLLLVKEIHMAAEKLDISDLIVTIMDVGLMPHSIPSYGAIRAPGFFMVNQSPPLALRDGFRYWSEFPFEDDRIVLS